jgi:hypothetical protein
MNARKTEKGHLVPVYKISKKIKTQRRDDAKFLLLEVYFCILLTLHYLKRTISFVATFSLQKQIL